MILENLSPLSGGIKPHSYESPVAKALSLADQLFITVDETNSIFDEHLLKLLDVSITFTKGNNTEVLFSVWKKYCTTAGYMAVWKVVCRYF